MDPVNALLDSQPIRFGQLLIVATVMATLLIDGIDTQLLSLTAPVILKEWSLSQAQFGPPMAAALVGMTVGASLGGWLGDRIGRKVILILSALDFGAATIAASLTHGVVEMTFARFISGIGFGAAQPNCIALATEWLPQRARARAVGLLSIGTPLGGMVGAGGLIWLLPLYGWRVTFAACGGLTCLMAVLMIVGLPESLGYLLAKGRLARASRVLRQVLGRTLTEGEVRRLLAPKPLAQQSGRIPMRAGYRLNAGVWLIFFGVSFTAYALMGWLPVLLTTGGFALAEALRGSFAFNMSAVVAAIGTGFLMNRFGSRAWITVTCAGTLGSVAMLAAALNVEAATAGTSPFWIVALSCAGAGGFTGSTIVAVYALLVTSYPVARRASGIGVGMMIGRLGAITSMLSGGALLSLGARSTLPFCFALAVLTVIAFSGVLVIDRHIAPAQRAVQVAGYNSGEAD